MAGRASLGRGASEKTSDNIKAEIKQKEGALHLCEVKIDAWLEKIKKLQGEIDKLKEKIRQWEEMKPPISTASGYISKAVGQIEQSINTIKESYKSDNATHEIHSISGVADDISSAGSSLRNIDECNR